jgi:Spy/CpxP family protein refolding chaperone
LALLSDANVKKDLQITDDQVKRLEEFQTKSRDEMRQAFQGLRDLTAEQRTAKFQELQKKTAEMTAAAEKEILLPKQIERLKQISLQARLNRGSTSTALASDELASELGITDAQKEALKKAQEEADAEIQAATAKLRETARQKILSVLTAEQQAKLKSLTGETIQFAPRGRGGAGGTGSRGTGGAPLNRPPQGD